jgi:hypothetical protein
VGAQVPEMKIFWKYVSENPETSANNKIERQSP